MNFNDLKKSLFLLTFLSVLLLSACNPFNRASTDPVEKGKQREQASVDRNNDTLGTYIDAIDFEVNTPDTTYEDGIIKWISIAKVEAEIPNLKNAEEIVISQNIVSIIIDYPLTKEYKFEIKSKNGFTRAHLIREISKAYYKVYEEEEASATTKTIPPEKRKTLYNRNETNGKYGIWGHDITDLGLSDIEIYETPDKKLVLALITVS